MNEDEQPFNTIWNSIEDFSHSPLDDMLNNESVTLEEVLGEGTLLQEVKGANGKVVEYLSRYENLSKLFDYLTKNPNKEEMSQQAYEVTLYQYPYVICELFCCEIDQINSSFKKHPDLFTKFFDYLRNTNEEEARVNPARSGYVFRAMGAILDKSYSAFADSFLKLHAELEKEGKDIFNELIFKQIHLADMEGFALKMFGFRTENPFEYEFGINAFGMRQFREFLMDSSRDESEAEERKTQIKEWAIENGFIEKTLSFLDSNPDNEFAQMNIMSIFETIIDKGENPLSQHLMTKEVLNKFIDILLLHSKTTLFVHGVNLLQKIIELNESQFDSGYGEQKLPESIATIAEHIPEFLTLLSEPTNCKVNTPSGVIESVFGETRLTALQLIRILYKLKYLDVQRALVKANSFNVIVKLFFEYEHNNILHSNGFTIIHCVLRSFENPEQMIKDSGLIEHLIEAYKTQMKREKKKEVCSSFMGHVVAIANLVIDLNRHRPELSTWIKDIKGWDKFTNYLQACNDLTNSDLGGQHRNNSYSFDHSETYSDTSSDDDEGDFTTHNEYDTNSQENEESPSSVEQPPNENADLGFGSDDFEANFEE